MLEGSPAVPIRLGAALTWAQRLPACVRNNSINNNPATADPLGGGRGDGDCRRQGWPHRECRVACWALSRQRLSVKKQARLAVAGERRWWRREGGSGVEAWRLLEVFEVFSQNKVLQRFVEQVIDDMVGLDGVQQRLVEKDLETTRVGLTWVWWCRPPP